MVRNYYPKQSDILFLDFNPTLGHEQKGYRPAIVISNNVFNDNTKMAMVLPISSNIKEFPTHHILKTSKKISGAVLCEHIKSIDYEARNIKYVETLNEDEFNEIIDLFNACIEKE